MTDNLVEHASIPGWFGERGWSAPGEPPSDFVAWGTEDEEQPYKMAHNRDLMMSGDQVEQDYNFIDYWFGDPALPVLARHYLDDRHVSVELPIEEGQSLSINEAKEAFPNQVLSYLQRRFDSIEVLVDTGYQTIWST